MVTGYMLLQWSHCSDTAGRLQGFSCYWRLAIWAERTHPLNAGWCHQAGQAMLMSQRLGDRLHSLFEGLLSRMLMQRVAALLRIQSVFEGVCQQHFLFHIKSPPAFQLIETLHFFLLWNVCRRNIVCNISRWINRLVLDHLSASQVDLLTLRKRNSSKVKIFFNSQYDQFNIY